jgi:RNA methyltransferase, TrmH family
MLSKNQLKEVQQLHLKKFRDAQRLFIAEGVKTVLELLLNKPQLVREIFATEEFYSRHEALIKNINVTVVHDTDLKKLSMQTTPNMALAVCDYFPADASDERPAGFMFYLDDIRDPGNMGTILRIAEWFGMKKVYCSPKSCDLYNPKVLQASMGSFLRVQVRYLLLSELLLKVKFTNVYGAVLGGSNLYEMKLQDGLIVIGNEANGIHESNLARITSPVTIPSAGDSKAESLNAAMAAAVIAAEFYRQLRPPHS